MENSKKIIREIKKLGSEIKPRPDFVTTNRDFLLRQISSQLPTENIKVGAFGYLQMFTQMFRLHLLEPVSVMLVIFGVFLSSSLTINAAFYSMPGSPLYRVKIALENTHAAMTTDDNQRVELKMEFAQKRVEELNKVATSVDINEAQKKEQIETIVAEFKNNVAAVKDHLAKMNQNLKQASSQGSVSDKEKAFKMAMSLSSKAQDLAQSFEQKANSLTDNEKLEVKNIINETVESAKQTSVSAQQLVAGANMETGTSTKTGIDGFGITSTPPIFK
ncbi:MAG: DUF5667 domain-containing protein [Candidatus Buchananbacteria bacterium]